MPCVASPIAGLQLLHHCAVGQQLGSTSYTCIWSVIGVWPSSEWASNLVYGFDWSEWWVGDILLILGTDAVAPCIRPLTPPSLRMLDSLQVTLPERMGKCFFFLADWVDFEIWPKLWISVKFSLNIAMLWNLVQKVSSQNSKARPLSRGLQQCANKSLISKL